MSLDMKWLAIAGVIGAGGAVFAMRAAAPTAATPVRPLAPVAAAAPRAAASEAPVRDEDPWAKASRAAPGSATPAAPVAMASASAASTDPGARLDDAALAKRAREVYGLECAAVVQRDPPRNGVQVITCASGFRYHVADLQSDTPAISSPPLRQRVRRAGPDDE